MAARNRERDGGAAVADTTGESVVSDTDLDMPQAVGLNGAHADADDDGVAGGETAPRLRGLRAALSAAASGLRGALRREQVVDDDSLPAVIDMAEEELREFLEREREWPTSKIDELPSIRSFFRYSHIADGSRLAREDGRRMVIFESSGKDITRANVQSFAGVVNSLQCPVQFLIRQHAPRLNGFRLQMRREREANLSERLVGAAEDLDSLLADLQDRQGMMDRRYYIICDEDNLQEVSAAIGRLNLDAGYLSERALDIFMLSASYGQSPADLPDRERFHIRETSRYVKSDNDVYRRTIWVKKFPRSITVGFLQSLLTVGIPMDLSLHLNPIPSEQAVSTLQSRLTSMQASANAQYKRTGQVGGAEQIALQDILHLRDAVLRGTERMFRANLCITIAADSQERLEEYATTLNSMLKAVLAETDQMTFGQRKGLRTTMPLGENATGRWTMLDTSTIALMFPFSPQDLDTRTGTLVGLDARARSLITFDEFNSRSAQNMNMAVLATSGAGKSFFTKLNIVRQVTRGVRVYVIDPEGEYVDTCIAAGGRVLTPGVPGQGMNPFVVTETGSELMERIDNLCKLLQVMIGKRLDPTQYGQLNRAMVEYYEKATVGGRGSWSGLYGYIAETEPDIAGMLSPFHSGSKRFLLSDEGNDLLLDEPPMTVFNLRLIESEMRAAAGMVCAETVWTMAARDPRRRKLVVDEVWSILQDAEGAGFMMNTAKRARKHSLGLTSITQDVQDLLAVNASEGVRGNSGRALIQNASYKILLRQDPASIGVIRETFDLPPEVAQELPSYPTGRGLLISPDGYYPMDIEAAPDEAEIIEWVAGRH